jgi:uncharacterized SAM-binding protein YcdF (DUF218 family)
VPWKKLKWRKLKIEIQKEEINRGRFSPRWLRRLGWVSAVGCILLVAAYFFRVPLLTNMARAWVVNEPVAKADAIVILGGGLENRPFAAANLFHNGVASRILYMNVRLNPAQELGLISTEGEITHRILLSNGVPDTAMTMIGTGVASTYDESKAVQAWIEKTGARSIVITTDLFHTRRARWVFRKELRNMNTDIHVVVAGSRQYKINDWWLHEQGLIDFQNEVIKFFYYHLKY